MNTTRAKLRTIPRPFRAVELPGGATVHVRHLTLSELERVDTRAAELPEGLTRNVRSTVVLCAYALAELDGSAAFPDVTDEDLELVSGLTPSQMEAICAAAVPSKADAKNA